MKDLSQIDELEEDQSKFIFNVFLGFMRLSDWDPDTFYAHKDVMDHLQNQSEYVQDNVRQGLQRVERLHYFLRRDDDVIQQLGHTYYLLEDYEESMRCFEKVKNTEYT